MSDPAELLERITAADRTLIRIVREDTSRMASSADDGSNHEDEIHLWREDDWWIARDVSSGVTTQGPSREVALANLDEAVALHNGEIGSEPTEEELRDLGIDPDANTTGDREPPDVLN